MTDEQTVDLAALKVLTKRFDEFVSECVDAKGQPTAPSKQAVAKARGYLPRGCKMSYEVVK